MKPGKLLFLVLAGFAFATCSYAREDVRETFACNFYDGKDMDDLMSARDFYLKQAQKAGFKTPNAFVWTPFKGDFKHDFLWFNDHADLQAFASATDVAQTTPEMAVVQARFDSIADCSSGLTLRRRVYDGGEAPVTTPPAFIVASACKLNHGVRIADLGDLWGHVTSVLDTLGKHKAFHFYVGTPYRANSSSHDLFMHRVNDSASAWAARVEALDSSTAGQALGRHFNSLLS